MSPRYSGRCLCGDISYSIDAEPVFSGNCHCRDCQRSSGGAYVPAMIFPEAAVTISGEVRYFESAGDSGHINRRGFCSNCGSQLFAKFEAMPGMLGVKAGALDDTSAYHPKLNFHVASAPPWDFMDPSLPKKERSPRG